MSVEYELPFGVLGDMANRVMMKRQIRSLFRHRQKMLPILLSAAEQKLPTLLIE